MHTMKVLIELADPGLKDADHVYKIVLLFIGLATHWHPTLSSSQYIHLSTAPTLQSSSQAK